MFSESDHSFVVCAYGESPYLEECIQSLEQQSAYTRIIMATSTPNALIEDVSERHGLSLFINPMKAGIKSDWNFAVAQAQTPLVTIAHQDDTYAPRYAEHMLNGMNRTDRPLIFFTNYGELRDGVEVDDNRLLKIKRLLLRPIKRKECIATDHATKRKLLWLGSAVCCPSVTLNMSVLPNPPFTSSMRSNLDWDAWERFSHMDGAFVYDNAILMHHRIHQGSETSALIRDNTRTQEDLQMLERFWPKPVARLLNLVYSRGQSSNS